jgi:hypothetical protein
MKEFRKQQEWRFERKEGRESKMRKDTNCDPLKEKRFIASSLHRFIGLMPTIEN